MRYFLIILLAFTNIGASCAPQNGANPHHAPAPTFISDNPEAIYAADPNDSWNRIFRAFFTRTVNHRMSDAFPEGSPFRQFYVRMGSFPLRISKEKFSKTELGDRAIEPVSRIHSQSRFPELMAALTEAIAESKERSPIERALMQADVWAAYDVLYPSRFAGAKNISDPDVKLLSLLRQFIRKLALSRDEIESLKSNYLVAVNGNKLPNLFSTETGWLEIELLPHRAHDEAANYRRAARVFVKPRTPPSDPGAFVESLKHNKHHDKVEAVALLIQNLLIDKSGRVVPSPLINQVQFRFFKNDPNTGVVSAEPQQFELSRRRLLTEPASGGFVEFSATSPAYLSAAGNDFEFASFIDEADAPIVVPLRTRCTQCHNSLLTTMMTYSIHDFPPVPTVRILKDRERALYVAQRKQEREEFKSLFDTI